MKEEGSQAVRGGAEAGWRGPDGGRTGRRRGMAKGSGGGIEWWRRKVGEPGVDIRALCDRPNHPPQTPCLRQLIYLISPIKLRGGIRFFFPATARHVLVRAKSSHVSPVTFRSPASPPFPFYSPLLRLSSSSFSPFPYPLSFFFSSFGSDAGAKGPRTSAPSGAGVFDYLGSFSRV